MHLPDGMLEPWVWGPLAGVAVGGVALAERSVPWTAHEHKIPLMGVLGAFVFGAQMFNFPLLLGGSGHLIGAALLALLVGPAAAILVMACILIVQCFLLQDGGLLALGANVTNLGILAPLVAWATYRAVRSLHGGPWLRTPAVFLAGWTSTVVPAVAAGVELGLSGRIPTGKGVALLLLWHALIGIPEGLITVAVLRFLGAMRPDIAPVFGRTAAPAATAGAAEEGAS